MSAKPAASPAKTPRMRRHDPPPRDVDQTSPWALLKDEQHGGVILRDGVAPSDGSHNVLVYENSPDAMASYEYRGYAPRLWGQSHIVPAAGRTGKNGEPITVRGHLLMFLPAQQYQEMLATGKAAADRKYQKIFGRGRPENFRPMRRPSDGELYADFDQRASVGVMDVFEPPADEAGAEG